MILTLEVNPEFMSLLFGVSAKSGFDVGEVFRRGLILLSLAVEAERNGGYLDVGGRRVVP